MTQPKVALVEVFAAPQGEGYNTGRWAIFVRLAGCPLACEFAPGVVCDTPYMDAKLKVTLDELFLEIIPPLVEEHTIHSTMDRDNAPMLIFTGGEPTACPQFPALVMRAYRHRCPTFYVAIETNGTKWWDVLELVDWITVSPKDGVAQTSSAAFHNPHPQSSKLNRRLIGMMALRENLHDGLGAEYRYVIGGLHTPTPPYLLTTRHYLSPAVVSDGSGEEWRKGFPGFAPGAVARCLDIVAKDPRWRISVQSHKLLGVR